MKKYDFILFEHTEAINHQKDVEMIALHLQHEGWRVAIAEVYNERLYCKNKDIPHITFNRSFSERFLSVEDAPNAFVRFVKNRIIMRKYHNYLCYIARELSALTDNVYVGSHENGFSFAWLNSLAPSVNVYVWGLRSYRLYEHKITHSPVMAYNSWHNFKILSRRPNTYFFISDELIREEFVNKGISAEKLIIRRERTSSGLRFNDSDKSSKTTFLSIGSIRPDKRIEYIIRAFRNISNDSIKYIIAGKTSERDKYESIIMNEISNDSKIERINRRLTEEEFNGLLKSSDFLVLCDKKQVTNVTNGTMNEALLNGKPIIAPNYDPYKFFIEKYKIGILFDPEDQQSLVRAILNAQINGNSVFKDAILDYQKLLSFEEISRELSNEIKKKQYNISGHSQNPVFD